MLPVCLSRYKNGPNGQERACICMYLYMSIVGFFNFQSFCKITFLSPLMSVHLNVSFSLWNNKQSPRRRCLRRTGKADRSGDDLPSQGNYATRWQMPPCNEKKKKDHTVCRHKRKLQTETHLQPARAAAIFLFRSLFSRACYTKETWKTNKQT